MRVKGLVMRRRRECYLGYPALQQAAAIIRTQKSSKKAAITTRTQTRQRLVQTGHRTLEAHVSSNLTSDSLTVYTSPCYAQRRKALRAKTGQDQRLQLSSLRSEQQHSECTRRNFARFLIASLKQCKGTYVTSLSCYKSTDKLVCCLFKL